jgi:hypothetical protein
LLPVLREHKPLLIQAALWTPVVDILNLNFHVLAYLSLLEPGCLIISRPVPGTTQRPSPVQTSARSGTRRLSLTVGVTSHKATPSDSELIVEQQLCPPHHPAIYRSELPAPQPLLPRREGGSGVHLFLVRGGSIGQRVSPNRILQTDLVVSRDLKQVLLA